MKTTDYARIAAVYDQNRDRTRIRQDETLARCLNERLPAPFRALDLACGTGSYLERQIGEFAGRNIEWHGLDRSPEMLALASEKLADVDLRVGVAEQLPYDDDSIDYISCHFAFHHFRDKDAVIDEMTRVLRDGGTVSIVNILPDLMREWWIYRYFPETWKEDQDRFWSHKKTYKGFTARGLAAKVDAHYRLRERPLDRLLADAQRRDISQISNLTDTDYNAGLERMRSELHENPRVLYEFTTLHCVATATGVSPEELSV